MSGLHFSLPSPIYGRGAGGEGEAKSHMFALRVFPLPNPLDETTSHSTRLQTTAAKSLVIPQAGEGTPL